MRGMTIELLEKTQTGVDAFNMPIFSENWVTVDNVLVGEPTTDDIINDLQLYGKRLAYVLAIPKGDTHRWVDTDVKFWGAQFKTYGYPTQGVEHNIPGPWNIKVKVERYG